MLVVVAEFYAGKYVEGKIGQISASTPAAPKLVTIPPAKGYNR